MTNQNQWPDDACDNDWEATDAWKDNVDALKSLPKATDVELAQIHEYNEQLAKAQAEETIRIMKGLKWI